jgi:hypothetical protein
MSLRINCRSLLKAENLSPRQLCYARGANHLTKTFRTWQNNSQDGFVYIDASRFGAELCVCDQFCKSDYAIIKFASPRLQQTVGVNWDPK